MKDELTERNFLRQPPSNEELLEAHDRQETFEKDLLWLAKDPRGQRLMTRLFKATGVFENPLDYIHADDKDRAMSLAMYEGMRAIGSLVFKDLLRVAPEVCVKLMTEQEEKAHD